MVQNISYLKVEYWIYLPVELCSMEARNTKRNINTRAEFLEDFLFAIAMSSHYTKDW